MDYRKLDPNLIVALEDAESPEQPFNVFVTTEPLLGPEQISKLENAGVANPEPGATTHTAQVTANDIEALTAEPYVRSLTLGSRLRPLRSRGI